MARTVPTIQSVYLVGANLTVVWYTVPDPSITKYVVTVFYGTNTVFTSQAFDASGMPQPQSGSFDLPGGVPDTNTSYFVQISTMWGNSPGQNQTSTMVPLITRLPVLRAGYFDGTDFYLEWDPSTQASQGYSFQLYSTTGNPFFGEAPGIGDTWGKIAGPALAGLQWNAQVAARGTVASNDGDRVYAANAATPLLVTQPSLTLTARYQRGVAAGYVSAQWTALAGATGVTRYRLQSYAPNGTPGVFADVPGVTSNSGALVLPDDFAPGSTLRLLALNNAGTGVSTTAAPVLTTTPILTAAAFASGTTINVAWRVDANAAITGFTVEVYNLANPAQSYTQSVPGNAGRSVTFNAPGGGLDATQAWGIRVWATGAAGSVPAVGEAWPLPVVAPALAALVCQGSELTVSWTLAATASPPAAFVVSLATGGAVAASLRVEGAQATQARLLVVDATKSYSVTVSAVGPGDAQGPPSASAIPLLAQVAGLTAKTDAITGLCTLSWVWNGAGSPDSYRLDFSDGTTVSTTATTFKFADPLPADAELAVRITALASAGGGVNMSLSGPATAPHSLPTRRAQVIDASFSAQAMTATAAWTPLPGATGYRVALMASKNGTLTEVANAVAPAGAEQYTVAFPNNYSLDSAAQYSMLVQGMWGVDLGLQANQAPIFASGFYVSTSAATVAPPFLYPATLITTTTSANNAMAGEPLTLYLPDIGAGSPLVGLPVPQGAFTLAANNDVNKNNVVYPYVLTISNAAASNNPWTFAPAQTTRTGLAADVQTFLKAVENAGVVPWGIALVQQILARLLPQTFAEQLYYNFGLTFPGAGVSQGSVDLRPGMVLRVVPDPYQTVTGQQSGSWLTGYVGTASIDYDVGSVVSANGAWNAGFDSFIGQLAGSGALSVSPPAVHASTGEQQGVAEAADLYFPGFTQSFYKLFVPNSLLSPSSAGSNKASDNFVLAAAPSFNSLCNATSAPSDSTTVAYFRGRAVLKACLRVTLNGVGQVVPVGTTLANLLEQNGRLAPAVPPPLAGVRIARGLGGAVLDPTVPSSPASMAVHLDLQAAKAAAYGPAWGVASLPLLPGDRVTLD